MSDSGKGQIEGAWINDTLRAVTALTDNGDEQLSILARALVVGCKSCGVDKDKTVEIVTALFDEQTTLVPFATLRTEAEAARAEEHNEDAKLDRAYANGMRAVLVAVWPFVKDQDRKLVAMLKILDAAADRRIAETRQCGAQQS